MPDTITLPIYDFVRKEEGGLVKLPGDTGGLTNFGITHKVYDKYREDRKLTPKSVAEIAEKEVFTIYSQYWAEAGCGLLDWPLNLAHFSFAFNAGPFQALRVLQRALNVLDDGVLGPVTQAAIKLATRDKPALYISTYRYLLEQVFYYDTLDVTKPENTKFLTTLWLNRVKHIYREIDKQDMKEDKA